MYMFLFRKSNKIFNKLKGRLFLNLLNSKISRIFIPND